MGERADYGNPPAYFRKEFLVDNHHLDSCFVEVSSLGVYKLYVNGEEADCDRLSPGWTDYSKRVYCNEFNITKLIKEQNCIGIILGDGWYCGRLGMFLNRQFYGNFPSFSLKITINFKDGSSECIFSDENWTVSNGAIRYSDLLSGEYVDGRLEQKDWNAFGFNDSKWEKPLLLSQPNIEIEKAICEPIRVKKILTPEKLQNNLFDFKQNFAGVVSLVVNGCKGSRIKIVHGEMLKPNNSVYTENLRSAYSTDFYVLNGDGDEYFEPLFTYHGFRYIQIFIEGSVDIISVVGKCFHTDIREVGNINTSNEIVNKIFENTFWSLRSNFMSIPTDCPQRDERLGWTADAQIFCGSAMFMTDCRKFFEKYLVDIRDTQGKDGGLEVVAPLVLSKFIRRRRGCAAWCDALPIITYEHYVHYGDKAIIENNLASIKRWIQYCLQESVGYIREDLSGYGDWLNLNDETDVSVIGTLYFARSTFLTYKLCSYIDDVDKNYYFNLYNNILNAFTKKYVEVDGKIKSDTQTSYILACAFKVLNAETIKPHLMRKLRNNGYKLSTGFLGTKYLLPVLCEIGEANLAYKIITDDEYPSWGYSIKNGATTIWERWNSYKGEEDFADVSMNSFNHYAYGACVEWMYKYMLGLNPSDESKFVGNKKIILKPYFDFGKIIIEAQGSYETDYGKISCSWKVKDSIVFYKMNKPQNVCVDVDLSLYNYEYLNKTDESIEFAVKL